MPTLQAAAEEESSILTRIRASTCAMQLEKSLLVVRENKLLTLLEQHQASEELPLSSSSTPAQTTKQLLGKADPFFGRAEMIVARRNHLQVCLPGLGILQFLLHTPQLLPELFALLPQGNIAT